MTDKPVKIGQKAPTCKKCGWEAPVGKFWEVAAHMRRDHGLKAGGRPKNEPKPKRAPK